MIVVCGVWMSWGSMLNVKYFILFQWILMWNGRLGHFFPPIYFHFFSVALLFLIEYCFSCFTMRITFRDFVNRRFAWSYIIQSLEVTMSWKIASHQIIAVYHYIVKKNDDCEPYQYNIMWRWATTNATGEKIKQTQVKELEDKRFNR